MDAPPVIQIEGLGKRYTLGAGSGERYVALRDVLANSARRLLGRRRPDSLAGSTNSDFWALKDVSFEVKRGEVVGIIGRNGAGKSTLLKILSRITEPTRGRIKLRGRVASLLEVGTGFHPELTGRENIFLNGAILGMSRVEIKAKFDEIVAFAEVERFLDTPVKRYSSGMYVRLAFAVAAHLEPEILIVDEVLAVGDAEFQQKCLGKMREVSQGKGRTVLFVSHNIAAVQSLCTHAIYLKSGQIFSSGITQEQVANYLRDTKAVEKGVAQREMLNTTLELTRFAFTTEQAKTGEEVGFCLELAARAPLVIFDLAMLFYSSLGTRVAILDLRAKGIRNVKLGPDNFVVHGKIHHTPLVEGEYRVGLYIRSDRFEGDFLDLADLTLQQQPPSLDGYIPYPVEYRGLVALEFSLKS